MNQAEIELKHKTGPTLLKLDLWTLFLYYFLHQAHTPNLDDCQLYVNGEEIPKPFWWDIE